MLIAHAVNSGSYYIQLILGLFGVLDWNLVSDSEAAGRNRVKWMEICTLGSKVHVCVLCMGYIPFGALG